MNTPDHRETENFIIHGLVPLGLSNAPHAHTAEYMKHMMAKKHNASIGRQYSDLKGVSAEEFALRLKGWQGKIGLSAKEASARVFPESESTGIASEIMTGCGGGCGCVIEPLHGSKEYCTTHNKAL